jgi:hypothetical protein
LGDVEQAEVEADTWEDAAAAEAGYEGIGDLSGCSSDANGKTLAHINKNYTISLLSNIDYKIFKLSFSLFFKNTLIWSGMIHACL